MYYNSKKKLKLSYFVNQNKRRKFKTKEESFDLFEIFYKREEKINYLLVSFKLRERTKEYTEKSLISITVNQSTYTLLSLNFQKRFFRCAEVTTCLKAKL